MLVFSLKDKNKNTYTEVHFDEKGGFHGFTIQENSVHNVNEDVFNVLDMLKLSEKSISCGIKDGYEIFYDENSGLYHFFKNGKEDIEKFWLENSVNATLVTTYHDRLDLAKSAMRKIEFLGYSLLISAIMCDVVLVNEAISKIENEWKMEVEYNESVGTISYTPLSRKVKFTFEGEEERFDKKVTSEKIYELIYSSENLNEYQKDFLWNSELINDVIPYYDDFQSSVVSQVRNYNISLESFGEDNSMNDTESMGYYSDDNILHIRNIPTGDDLDNDIEGKRVIGHEYVHLLQVNDYLKFLTESSAELITHEYFLNSSDSSLGYAYDRACRYTKILMEIIGTEAIWDYNFRSGSTSVQNAVKPYFDENEYSEFFHIMTLSPFWDKEELEGGLYERLEELLGVLYNRKYNEDIESNDLINAIKLGVHHNRAYFRKSLIEKELSFYIKADTMTLEEAEEMYGNDISFSRQIGVNRSESQEVYERLVKEGNSFNSHFRVIDGKYQVQNVVMESIEGQSIKGIVTLKNGEELIDMDIEEAYSKGLVNIESVFNIPISYDEFKRDYKKGEYFVNLYDNRDSDWKFNYENMIFVGDSYNTIECEEKIISLEEAYNLGFVKFTLTKVLSEEEYLNRKKFSSTDSVIYISLKNNVKVLENKYALSGNYYIGSIVVETNNGPKEIEVNEAIKLGLVEKVYELNRSATLEEYLANRNNGSYRLHTINTKDVVVKEINSKFNGKEFYEDVVSILEYKKNIVPSITLKVYSEENNNRLS